MIKTVIFDLDDTLYDEIDYCKSGFAAVSDFLADLLKIHSAEKIFDCLWEQFTTGNRKTTFDAALDKLGVTYDDNLIGKLVKVYRDHTPKITLPADSKNVLRQLSDKYTLALLTDGFLPAQQLKVKALGIEKYFKSIIYTEELGRKYWKPSPAGFEKLMKDLNAKAPSVAYVADNEQKDFIAPNKLGFLSIQLIRHSRIHTAASVAPTDTAQHIIYKIRELPNLLESL